MIFLMAYGIYSIGGWLFFWNHLQKSRPYMEEIDKGDDDSEENLDERTKYILRTAVIALVCGAFSTIWAIAVLILVIFTLILEFFFNLFRDDNDDLN